MSYNKRNKLERISEIQRITLEHTRRGVTQQWVYDNVIRPSFFISIGTYYSYLGCNAKAELKKIEEAKAEQLSLHF